MSLLHVFFTPLRSSVRNPIDKKKSVLRSDWSTCWTDPRYKQSYKVSGEELRGNNEGLNAYDCLVDKIMVALVGHKG